MSQIVEKIKNIFRSVEESFKKFLDPDPKRDRWLPIFNQFLANVNSRRLSVTFVRPTQAIEIFGHVSTPFGTLAIC